MRLHFMMANEAPGSTNVRFNVGRDVQTQIDDFRISSSGFVGSAAIGSGLGAKKREC
jgi:hypothetical protein